MTSQFIKAAVTDVTRIRELFESRLWKLAQKNTLGAITKLLELESHLIEFTNIQCTVVVHLGKLISELLVGEESSSTAHNFSQIIQRTNWGDQLPFTCKLRDIFNLGGISDLVDVLQQFKDD